MSTVSVSLDNDAAAAQRGWITAAVLLAVGAVLFAIAFRTEAISAVGVWDASTAYNHCYLILPISAYLVWERWRPLMARTPRPEIWPVAAMLPLAAIWLFAERAGVMEGRQLMAMGLFQLFVFAVLGFAAWRLIAFALLYLFFLVPTGAFLTPYLQVFAAHFAVDGLQILGVPVYADGMEIQVPGANFVIAEACAGLRFLIASVALGTLYGYLMYRSAGRRVAFVIVSIIVPIIANGFRCLGLVLYGYWLGNAEAAMVDHILYGWLFFSIVSLVLIMLGLPFRQPMPTLAMPDAAIGSRRVKSGPGRFLAVGLATALLVGILVSPMTVNGPPGNAMASAATGLKHALGR